MSMRAILIPCALALAGTLTGCQTCPAPTVLPGKVIDTACNWVKPITASASDTPDTKKQILAHDLAVQKNCPQK